jgi:hypothetical protein
MLLFNKGGLKLNNQKVEQKVNIPFLWYCTVFFALVTLHHNLETL